MLAMLIESNAGELELFEDGSGLVGIRDELGEAEAAAAGAGEGVDVVDAA